MHKASTVLDAIVTAITGLATTGSNVSRTRSFPRTDLPSITVRLAIMTAETEVSNSVLNSIVEVETAYYVANNFDELDADILQIDAEVYAAIMADRTLGGVAYDVDPIDLSVESSAEAEKQTAIGIRRWRIRVRHSITDAEA